VIDNDETAAALGTCADCGAPVGTLEDARAHAALDGLACIDWLARWTINSALAFIRELQPRAMEAGWCILLGGGVLNRGESKNDLDLLAYPRTATSERAALIAVLPHTDDVTWSTCSVADIAHFNIEGRCVELIFQTFVPGGSA